MDDDDRWRYDERRGGREGLVNVEEDKGADIVILESEFRWNFLEGIAASTAVADGTDG